MIDSWEKVTTKYTMPNKHYKCSKMIRKGVKWTTNHWPLATKITGNYFLHHNKRADQKKYHCRQFWITRNKAINEDNIKVQIRISMRNTLLARQQIIMVLLLTIVPTEYLKTVSRRSIFENQQTICMHSFSSVYLI